MTSARGVYGHQVAEHALALVLACSRRLGAAGRASQWTPDELRGSSLSGRWMTVVGAGDIGRALLRMLRPLQCRTIAVNRSGNPVPEAETTLPAQRMDEALARADVVVLAAPSTPATAGLLNARALSRMRTTSYLVNVARGELVVTDALVAALESGR